MDVDDYLKMIPGFAKLFGSQDFCSCEHCSSIPSPAAYFVDLMSFVDDQVRRPYFLDRMLAGHPLDLRTHRPDLWQLPLTCENTTTPVRHLDLITEVLEAYLVRRDQLSGRDTVYRRLAATVDSFHQPFTLPLAQLTEYLRHFGIDRGDITAAATRPSAHATRSAARLGLSAAEYRLIP